MTCCVLQMKSIWVCVDFIKSLIKKIRLRLIPDKRAMLVLVWNLLLPLSVLSFSDYAGYCLDLDYSDHKVQLDIIYYPVGSSFIFLLSGLFSAWLVGWKYRLVDIVFTGMIITGVAFLVGAIPNIIPAGPTMCNRLETKVIKTVYYTVISIGMAPVVTNLFQLAIEQMPDASSSQLSSLISWFLFSCVCGTQSPIVINDIFRCYLTSHSENALNCLSYFTLASGIIIAFILATFALMKHKLVDNSPTSNTVSHIYQAVKYAIKHRRPVQRSAMTYWEEEIPRGMDLGKRKYGGPFTSEQVEDVKTFFRLSFLFVIAIFFNITLNISAFSLYFVDKEIEVNNQSFVSMEILEYPCHRSNLYKVFEIYYLWILMFIVVYEVIIKTLLGHKISDLRKRLKFGLVYSFLVLSVIAIIITINRYSTVTDKISFWLQVVLSVPMSIASAIILIAGSEFVIAQTPYAMRNFFINVAYTAIIIVIYFSKYIFFLFISKCKNRNCPLIYSLVSLSLNFVAMLLLWIAITRYRMRSRGQEDKHQQRWIEEVYDRYLEHVDK